MLYSVIKVLISTVSLPCMQVGAHISPVFGSGHSYDNHQLYSGQLSTQYHPLTPVWAWEGHHPWPGYPEPSPSPACHFHTGAVYIHLSPIPRLQTSFQSFREYWLGRCMGKRLCKLLWRTHESNLYFYLTELFTVLNPREWLFQSWMCIKCTYLSLIQIFKAASNRKIHSHVGHCEMLCDYSSHLLEASFEPLKSLCISPCP